MRIDELNNRHLIADEGKVLRRISDGWIAGREIYLGYTYYLNNELLSEPLLELPEHYDEVDEPQTEDTVLLDENVVWEEVVEDTNALMLEEEEEAVPVQQTRRITVADYLALEEKVNALLDAQEAT